MPPASPSPAPGPAAPPALPTILLEPWRVIAVGACGWLLGTVLAVTVPTLDTWRPVSLAGLGVGLLGTSIFLWQKRAALRGARGAQRGLPIGDYRDHADGPSAQDSGP